MRYNIRHFWFFAAIDVELPDGPRDNRRFNISFFILFAKVLVSENPLTDEHDLGAEDHVLDFSICRGGCEQKYFRR